MPASAPPSPDDLLAQYRAQGDPEALGALFDAVAPTLHRIALSLLSDVHDADDALQATFLALLQHPERPDPDRPVVPWLVGVLRNEVHRLRRASRHRDAPPAPSGDANAALADDADVRRALEALPEPYRAPSLLRWRYGLTPAEIAHVRDEPPGTTRSLLARALSQLRRKLRGKILGAGPLAGGLDGVREAVLAAASHARASAARVTMWSSLMTTKTVVPATVAGVVALAAAVAWFTPGPSDARSTRGDSAHMARTREVARQPESPTLHGVPGEGRTPERASVAMEPPPADADAPAAVEDPVWPTPEKLRYFLDARATTEAILDAVEGVNQTLRPRVPVRLLEFDAREGRTRGLIRAETSLALDTTTRALSELRISSLGKVQFIEVDATAAHFRFAEATPAQGEQRAQVRDTWEPGEDLSPERLGLGLEQPDVPSHTLRPLDPDPSLRELGLQRRRFEIKVSNLPQALSMMRRLDTVPGVRVTRVQWTTNESTDEVSATMDLTLRGAEPPK